MPNRISPVAKVIQVRDPVVLEVEVDDTVQSFTWVVLDNAGLVVDTGAQARTPHAGDNLNFTFTSQVLAVMGGYRMQLLDGTPAVAVAAPLPAGTTRLADDSFAVLTAARAARFGGGLGPGDLLRVNLTGDSESPPALPQFPDFQDFQAYLAGGGGGGAPHPDPPFGSNTFLQLAAAARTYVATFTVQNFAALFPPGYLAGRTADPRHQIPLDAIYGHGLVPARPLPGVELIWNYWQEEGMLVQTLNVILARFQNRRIPGRDPLSRFDVTPLLGLRNLLWGFVEEEQHRLTVRRRAAEYEYEYGLSLLGRAVPSPRSNVERRSAFLAAFHQVIHQAHLFYKELDDLTVNADAFPLAQALRECHLVLSQGSHNQYGEMAVAARAEFLVMQSILAEPQMGDFLGGRPMTPYEEAWMDRVDSMKTIQGWTDTSVMHFHDLATLGEQLVLTIRLGNWAGSGVGSNEARTWATVFRNAIQRYAAAYRSATGVDLARQADSRMPSTLLARKVGQQLRA